MGDQFELWMGQAQLATGTPLLTAEQILGLLAFSADTTDLWPHILEAWELRDGQEISTIEHSRWLDDDDAGRSHDLLRTAISAVPSGKLASLRFVVWFTGSK